MKIGRLLAMGIDEISARGLQAGSRLAERALPMRRASHGPRALLKGLAGGPETAEARARIGAGDLVGAAALLLERFRAGIPGRFFPGAGSDRTAGILAERLPAAGAEAVAAAASIARGRFDLLGYRGLSFGDPVDWHLDPVSRKRAPVLHWSLIDPLDPDRVGDSKVVWELNRHQWMVRLGQAYRLTGDEAHARLFVTHLMRWIESNPAGTGINWSSSLEVALRLIAWCWALCLFRDSPALTPPVYLEALAAIRAHAAHVERYLSRYFSPNTHLTGEALGLFYAGVVWPDLCAAARWRALGARILEEQIARQVLPDGVHFERSTCYQRYTAEIYLHYLILAERNGIAAAPAVADRLRRLLDALLALRLPDGSSPPLGDADGGWLLPLAGREPGDLRGVFAIAAAFFGSPEYAWAAGGVPPEAVWVLGRAVLDAGGGDLRPSAPRGDSPSRLLADGGYAVLRGGWEPAAHQLIFDVGPLGCPVSGGHGHAALLGIQCAAFGEPFIVDPGTGSYAADTPWRDHFRSTAAHSSVMVDGRGQAVPAGPFAWATPRPRARLRRFSCSSELDFADAEHDAYGRLADPVVHRRRVIFARTRYFVIVDDLLGEAEHEVELRFQLAPIRAELQGSLWARARGSGRHGLLVRPFAGVRLRAEILEGRTSPIAGWVSPDYGRRRPAPLLVYRARARLPLRLVTLLLPVEDADAPLPDVSPLRGAGPATDGLLIRRSGHGPEIVWIDEEGAGIGRP
jgi:hypothetical protein